MEARAAERSRANGELGGKWKRQLAFSCLPLETRVPLGDLGSTQDESPSLRAVLVFVPTRPDWSSGSDLCDGLVTVRKFLQIFVFSLLMHLSKFSGGLEVFVQRGCPARDDR